MATLADAREKAETRIKEIEARDELTKVQVATLTSKLPDAPEATAAVVWDPERQRGVLNTANMPPNATNRDYQLWVVDPRYENPVDAGVFTVEKAGGTKYFFTPKSRITSATAFAISLERKGGVPKAEGPIVLAGK
jgi:anti-sigma-K factor RskA